MGRLRTNMSETERVAHKRKQADKRNEQRRERYHADAEYRESCRGAARNTWRNTVGTEHPELEREKACLEGLSRVEEVAVLRPLVVAGAATEDTKLTLTSSELAPLLGLAHVVMLHKWQRRGKFPRPELRVQVGRTHAEVYTVQQARKLIEALMLHYAVKTYFFDADEETIVRLHAAM